MSELLICQSCKTAAHKWITFLSQFCYTYTFRTCFYKPSARQHGFPANAGHSASPSNIHFKKNSIRSSYKQIKMQFFFLRISNNWNKKTYRSSLKGTHFGLTNYSSKYWLNVLKWQVFLFKNKTKTVVHDICWILIRSLQVATSKPLGHIYNYIHSNLFARRV